MSDIRLESVSALGRKFIIRIPLQEIEKEKTKRLQQLSTKVRRDGFRPGKVPFSLIKKDYGHEVYHEVIENLMKSKFEKAVIEHKLTLADRPQIRVLHTDHQHAAECEHEHGHHEHHDHEEHDGHDHAHHHHAHETHAHHHEGEDYFEFEASFDVYPEIKLPDLSSLVVEKLIPVISEHNIEESIQRLQRANANFEAVDRAAQAGDRILSHTKGTLKGEETPFMDRPMEISLGQHAFLEEFEKHVMGIKKDETRTFHITFPHDYQANMAGKQAEFVVTANVIEAPQLPLVDEAFCEKIGFKGSVEELRTTLRSQMENSANATSRKIAHEKVLKALHAACHVDVPESLVQKEIAEISHPQNPQRVENAEQTARDRVAFSLLLGQYIREHNIQANPELVREVIRGLVGNTGNPDEMLKWLLKDQQRMARVQALALEETALDELLTKVTLSEKEIDFDKLMKGDVS